MHFQTPTFGLFLAVVVLVAGLLEERARPRKAFLLAASWVFYMAWDPRFLGLILFSTVLDYCVGLRLRDAGTARVRKLWLVASLVGNLGVLGLFKYYDFFAESLGRLLAALGFGYDLPLLHLILPVGISFYTFQTLSYTIDVYRGELAARESLLDFALFVAFFPQLVAGPIVRARQFLPQLERRPLADAQLTGSGIFLILKGLVKKVVFADVIGSYLVDPVFADPASHAGLWILLAVYGFKFQIYNDFSGYSDIAIGCGRLLGFELPVNFRSPFKALSFSDYWRRWHMTLGSWFRDYVFHPLGGTRNGFWKTNLYILVTWLLVGLWHGAAWTFVLWGGLHGICLVAERLYRRAAGERPRTGWLAPLKVLGVFHATLLAMMVFRAPDLGTVRDLLEAAGRGTSGLEAVPEPVWWAFALAVVAHYLPEALKERTEVAFGRAPAPLLALAIVAVLLLIRIVGQAVEPFYYFQF